MTRPRCAAVLSVLTVLALLVLTGCGVPTDPGPRALDAGAAPFRSLTPETSSPQTGAVRVVVFLVRDGALVAVPRRVEQATPGPLLEALITGPSEREQEDGLTTAVPPELRLAGPGRRGSVVRVDLPAADASAGARTDEVVGLGQLVLTMTRLPGVRGVQVFRDNQVLSVPRADGSLTAGVLRAADYAALLRSTAG